MADDQRSPGVHGENGSGPVTEPDRITSLDLLRGVAVLVIVLMNAVSFKHGLAPYINLSAGGSETWLDWTIGVFGEVFIDQKFMGIFSLLFGAGILLFIERAERREGRPVLLNLWRNVLLLGIGLLHAWLWDGDVLIAYAVAAVFLLALRKLPSKALIGIGAAVYLLSVPLMLLMQAIANGTDVSLAGIWEPGELGEGSDPSLSEGMGALLLLGYFLRALGLILMGAGLYRLGFMNGSMAAGTYRLVAALGLGIGLSLATVGVVVTALGDYSRDVAFIGQVPNTLGSIPASLGYMSLIILWNKSRDNWLKRRLLATGRMALTNYLSQTVLGMLVLNVLLGDVSVTRTGIFAFCMGIWVVQLWWSPLWLSRFRFGPAEWLWRVATYRKGQPLRRRAA
ncbi:MAG: DUF418 domain-containing protein [Chloroflexi bacterium]|nr:DUF418 domain-containing protein [Chloroflexota bacterium]MYB83684.1 DUF418 domain-containing protein [Chloroflexota bacterium]